MQIDASKKVPCAFLRCVALLSPCPARPRSRTAQTQVIGGRVVKKKGRGHKTFDDGDKEERYAGKGGDFDALAEDETVETEAQKCTRRAQPTSIAPCMADCACLLC